MKQALKRLSKLGLEVNYALDRGIGIFGMNLSHARKSYAERSENALAHCRTLTPATVLDVGSGGGQHAGAFATGGAQVTCIDYGTSIYAKTLTPTPNVHVVNADFAAGTRIALMTLFGHHKAGVCCLSGSIT